MGIGYSSFKHGNVLNKTIDINDFVEVKKDVCDDDVIVSLPEGENNIPDIFEKENVPPQAETTYLKEECEEVIKKKKKKKNKKKQI